MIQCDVCDGHRWLIGEYEDGLGFVEIACWKCNWPRRPTAPIPAPVDALAFVSHSKRIKLGEDEAWRQYAKEQQR